MPSIDHLQDRELWSESVHLDCFSPDGQTGFSVRLCRYPTERTAWLWCFVFAPDGVYMYNDNYLECGDQKTSVEDASIAYTPADPDLALFHREGTREAPDHARVVMDVLAHAGVYDPPYGPGSTPVRLEATFRPGGPSASTKPGRVEFFGEVHGTARAGGRTIDFSGLGQWHEQHLTEPRFRNRFVACSLRGPGLEIVTTAYEDGRSWGYVTRGEERLAVRRFTSRDLSLDPVGASRMLEIELEDGTVLKGRADAAHLYTVGIYGMRRPSSVAVAEFDGRRVSGWINEMTDAELPRAK
jgi:hypothetical protein